MPGPAAVSERDAASFATFSRQRRRDGVQVRVLSPFELFKRDTIRAEPLLRDTIVEECTIASLK